MRRTPLIALAVLGILLSPRAAGAAEAPVQVGEPRPLPALAFQDMEGTETTLAAFAGQVVVLNLWATWCAPCREEMPSLDRLQARFQDQGMVVLALSVDRAGPERVQAFLDEVGVRHLRVYRDPTAAATRTLKVPGLPATILVDKEGREAGRVPGIARWDGPQAVEAVQRLLDGRAR
jgi:thiol-disulfide isomerase/thioredoxin